MTFIEVVERYKSALPAGQFYHFPITAMDHTGICSWSSVFLPGPLGGGDGYGLTDVEAEVGTLGELHERLQSLWVIPTLKCEGGSYNDGCILWRSERLLTRSRWDCPPGVNLPIKPCACG